MSLTLLQGLFLPARLAHPLLYEGAVVVHACGTTLEGSWENGGEAGGLIAPRLRAEAL